MSLPLESDHWESLPNTHGHIHQPPLSCSLPTSLFLSSDYIVSVCVSDPGIAFEKESNKEQEMNILEAEYNLTMCVLLKRQVYGFHVFLSTRACAQ